jgi:FecR protein
MRQRPWFCGYAGGVVRLFVVVLALGFGALTAWADDTPHRAARLSYLEGSVTVDRTNNTGSDTAQLNMPLAQGQRITTGETGQAEIEFEDGTLVRLTPYSTLSLDSLTVDGNGNFDSEMSVVSGLVYAELRATPKYVYRISVGADVITPVENATIRINMDQPPAVISVFNGAVNVENNTTQPNYHREVRTGESLREDSSADIGYFLTQMIVQDSWDGWNEDRDKQAGEQAANQTSARDGFAGQEGYGWSDLDANGTWYDVQGLGQVWQPAAALDESFDPYGYGSWVSYPTVGYVWASGYRWGWTPFRCGNWSYWGGFGWGWMPNGGCGVSGWGFPGGVFGVNVLHPPLGYHPIPLPGHPHGPGGPRPLIVARPGRGPNVPAQQVEGERTIAGRTATPLPVVTTSYQSHGESGALQRDFSIDSASGRPITGVVAATHGELGGESSSRYSYRSTVPSSYGPGSVIGRSSFHGGASAPVAHYPYSSRPAPPPPHISAPPAHSAAPSGGAHTR